MDQTCSAPAAPAGLTVQVCFPAVRAAVLDNLNRQREEGRLCDLSIQVQGQVFRAHRCVLAASSPYFHDQVLLKNVTTVSLPSVMDPVAFESVLSSAYTGQLSIVHDDIVNYVTVASFLQMWHIVDKCTEILKRPRSSVEVGPGEAPAVAPGSASRQQSPSSTDCIYMEREDRRKDRNPDALPPLATWRRPQQFPRWGRQKPSSAQHLADSQLDSFAGCAESEYSNSEETWLSSNTKTSHFGHDGPGHYSRHHGGFPGGEPLKQRARFTQRGPTLGADRPLDKNRESRESDELQEKKRNEKRAIEPDEGVGEQEERKESCAEMGHSEFRQSTNESQEVGKAAGKGGAEEKVGSNPSADLAIAHGCDTAGPGSAQLPWQAASWSQQEPRLQEGAGGPCGKNEGEEEELECFGRDTYDEIEDGTGQVSQRPLVPVSPDFTTTGSEGTWSSTGMGQGGSLTPTSSRHLSPSTASFPPSSSPPTPSSSSSVSLAGAPYTGKVHFCHCGKAYTLKSMRDRHVKMQHLNLRPFGCPVCAKTFKMKHHLTKHLKTHGGLRPYECNLCGKKVIWRDSFLRHQARCERLASGSSANSNSTSAAAAAADMEEGCSYGFEDREAFLPTGGHVKVEQVDFHGEMEGRMDGLLGNVSGIVDNLRSQSQHLNAGSHVFKEEERESFG
ncbi:zinc finger and BTB domain-containing protein 22 [Thalassophryne amazonica]|uniref:zinc finger and BTB domain-containing protein 22 n=1 Tax=Thalassophryne amazonica TaxID=390379 RepID=UPI001470E74F|nr:zinc finger and BTB domain-containing protein 22 [Thalassophryne amazonica]XP_034016903.1 zinc finger and BTB domain-containing protein 22 [Thalassophryne amazonica]